MTRRQTVCALYKQGLSERAVARQLRVSCGFVHDTLVRNNVARRGMCARSPEWHVQYELRLAQAAALYMAGNTYAAVEERVRIGQKRIKAAVIRFGGEIRRTHRKHVGGANV